MKLMLRILVFVFLVAPFTAVQTYETYSRFNDGVPVDIVDVVIVALLCLLSAGYLVSFVETTVWAWRQRREEDEDNAEESPPQ